MFQNTNKPMNKTVKTGTTQPTPAQSQSEKELTELWKILPHFWLAGIGIAIILFWILLKRGWIHRFFNLIGSMLDRFRR